MDSALSGISQPSVAEDEILRVFAFLDLRHPPVAWAVMRGMMVSADHALPTPHQAAISFMMAGMIERQNNARIYNETIIDAVRQRQFPARASRLRGMYFFGSRSEAEARIGDPLWPRYFRTENLLELELYTEGPPTKVDSNWITHPPDLNDDGRIKANSLDWIEQYWAGQPKAEPPIWEILANGVALILDESVRRRMYDYVKAQFPAAEAAIVMSRLASEAGSRGGLIFPYLLRKGEGQVELQYRLIADDFDIPEVAAKMSEHPDFGYLAKLLGQSGQFRLPDFTPWSVTFHTHLQFAAHESATIVAPSVHQDIS